MAWVLTPEFEQRTREHLKKALIEPLERGHKVIVTHASRKGHIGFTSLVLAKLSRRSGLVDAPLLSPEDAPHNQRGYAIPQGAKKRRALAVLVKEVIGPIEEALNQGRVLVAGDFAKRTLEYLIDVPEQVCLPHPCSWRFKEPSSFLAPMQRVLGDAAPGADQVACYLDWAHRQLSIARWAHLTPQQRSDIKIEAWASITDAERERRKRRLAEVYAALPEAEKRRRAQGVADRYAALPQEEKNRRARDIAARYAALPEERKAAEGARRLGNIKAYWASLTKEQRSAHGRKANAGKSAEMKRRCLENMRRRWREAMTPEKIAAASLKKKAAWTAEMRVAAGKRVGVNNKARGSAATMRKFLDEHPEVERARVGKRLSTLALSHVEWTEKQLANPPAKDDYSARRRLSYGQKYIDYHDAKQIVLTDEQLETIRKGIAIGSVPRSKKASSS